MPIESKSVCVPNIRKKYKPTFLILNVKDLDLKNFILDLKTTALPTSDVPKIIRSSHYNYFYFSFSSDKNIFLLKSEWNRYKFCCWEISLAVAFKVFEIWFGSLRQMSLSLVRFFLFIVIIWNIYLFLLKNDNTLLSIKLLNTNYNKN